MLKKILITVFGLLVIIGGIGAIKGLQIAALIAAGANMVMPAEAVTTAVARQETWESTLSAVGSLAAVQGVTLGAEIPGKVVEITGESGATVKAGDLLVRLDTSSEEAMLRSATAEMAFAKSTLDRAVELVGKQTISQSERDKADAEYKQAAAKADGIRATIAKKTVRAPFAGRLGIRLVNLGQTLREGDAIFSLQSLDPIYANFSLPQQRLAQLQRGLTVRVTADGLPGQVVEGRITAINPEIDAATRNARLQATLANASERLQPGMYVNVAVVLPEKNTVIVIPATSVLYAPYGDSVFVVEDKKDEKTGQVRKVVRQQLVRLGAVRGDFVAVTTGIKAGDVVVSTAPFKLSNGAPVTVENALAPDAQLAPKPGNS